MKQITVDLELDNGIGYIYDVKYGNFEYNIYLDKNEDGYNYSISLGSMQIDGDFFETQFEALEHAVNVICGDDEIAYKVLIRDIKLNDILE